MITLIKFWVGKEKSLIRSELPIIIIAIIIKLKMKVNIVRYGLNLTSVTDFE